MATFPARRIKRHGNALLFAIRFYFSDKFVPGHVRIIGRKRPGAQQLILGVLGEGRSKRGNRGLSPKILAPIPARGDVIEGIRKFYANGAGHDGGNITRGLLGRYEYRPDPWFRARH